jgi:hypothetical protein
MLAGCQSTTGGLDAAPSARILPSARDVVPAPVPRPEVRVREDLGLIARRFADYGDFNAERLRQAAGITSQSEPTTASLRDSNHRT